MLIAVMAVGPVSAATALPANQIIGQATSSAIAGSVQDAQGAPVSNAQVVLTGAASYSTRTDSQGRFAVSGVKPGIYSIVITKNGFNPASQQDIVVAAGTTEQLTVTMQQPTLTSLREIGSVTAVRRGTFNTTTASVQNITAATYANQAQPQVQRILDQTPGVVVDHPGTSATNASPGAITFPSIRGGLGFETASLIDGHPLAVGTFGDYVTTFLNSYTLQNTELIKGPGANSPVVNYAIGGTINFRTKDPTRYPTGQMVLGVDGFGGQFSNFGYSGTTTNGKFGWVLDYAVNGSPGPLRGSTAGFYNLPSGVSINGGAPLGFTTNAVPGAAANGIQNNPFFYSSTLEAQGFPVAQTYSNKTELVKFRYKFSDATGITLSYLGSQTWTDQNGNHVYGYNQLFTPCATGANAGKVVACPAYAGSVPNGSTPLSWQNVFVPFGEWEVNNEPIFQGELHTTLGKDTVLLRGYGAAINRLQYTALDSPLQPFSQTFTLYGTDTAGKVYNGLPAVVAYPTGQYQCVKNGNNPFSWTTNAYTNNPAGALNQNCYYTAAGALVAAPAPGGKTVSTSITSSGTYFRSMEEDHIRGLDFEYDHFIPGDKGNVLTLGYDTSTFSTHSYAYKGQSSADSIPDGSRERFGTLLLRGVFNFNPKLRLTWSNYFNTYYQRASNDGGLTFTEFNSSHFDPRVGIVYRPNQNISYRASAGSAIAPPYLGLMSNVATVPTPPPPGGTFVTNKGDNLSIKPETSFGYDVGADYRFGKDLATTATFDLYSTTLWNQFITQSFVSCANYNVATQTCVGAPGAGVFPLVTSQNNNLGQALYQGIEAGIRRDPLLGLGGLVQGALLRATPVNLPPCFYSTTPTTACNATTTNLGIIPGANFYGSGTGGSPGTFNAVNNHAIPYAQGYGELHYTWSNGMYASLGSTYYGNHNSYNVPPFFVTNATFKVPVGAPGQTLQLSVDNLFEVYSNAYINPFNGIGVPLANGKLGLTNANVVGPRNIRLVFTKNITFGQKTP